jgi:hypothetical protein
MPQQALALANSSLCLEQARLLAGKLEKELSPQASRPGETEFVTAAFERVLGRLPTRDELNACEAYLLAESKQLADLSRLAPCSSGPASAVPPSADPRQRAREDLVHVLFNHNDFVTIR